MKFYHVAQGFYFLGNRGLKCEHMGGIMVDEKDCPAGIIVYYLFWRKQIYTISGSDYSDGNLI